MQSVLLFNCLSTSTVFYIVNYIVVLPNKINQSINLSLNCLWLFTACQEMPKVCTGLKINFLTHLQNLTSASKMYSLIWNHYLLNNRITTFLKLKSLSQKNECRITLIALAVWCNPLAESELACVNLEAWVCCKTMWSYYPQPCLCSVMVIVLWDIEAGYSVVLGLK